MFAALRNYNYKLFWYGQLVSLTGTWMQTVGLSWLVLSLTGSSVALGTVTMLQFLPILLFALVGGVVADRVPKRRFLLFTQSIALTQAAALGILVSMHRIQLWEIYLLSVVGGLNTAFDNPTRQAFVVEMVGKEDLPNAVALNSGLFNAARIVGPAIGGLTIEHLGMAGTFNMNAGSYIAAIIALLLMKPEHFHHVPLPTRGKVFHQVLEGWKYCFSLPETTMIIVLMAVVGTIGYNFTVTLPLLARFTLHRGASALGTLTASMGAGSLVGAFYMARRTTVTRRLVLGGGLFFVIFLGLVSLSRGYVVICLLLVATGAASILFNASANTLMQLNTPDQLRGRVMSIFFLLLAGSTPIGGYLTGLSSKYIRVGPTMGYESLVCALGIAWAFYYYRANRMHLKDLQDTARRSPTAVGTGIPRDSAARDVVGRTGDKVTR